MPFASVSILSSWRRIPLEAVPDVETLKNTLTLRIEEIFGIDSVHLFWKDWKQSLSVLKIYDAQMSSPETTLNCTKPRLLLNPRLKKFNFDKIMDIGVFGEFCETIMRFFCDKKGLEK